MKTLDIVGIIFIGWPMIILGWVVSNIVTSFSIGYESFMYGEYKRKSLYQSNKAIDRLLRDIELIKKDNKDV